MLGDAGKRGSFFQGHSVLVLQIVPMVGEFKESGFLHSDCFLDGGFQGSDFSDGGCDFVVHYFVAMWF